MKMTMMTIVVIVSGDHCRCYRHHLCHCWLLLLLLLPLAVAVAVVVGTAGGVYRGEWSSISMNSQNDVVSSAWTKWL